MISRSWVDVALGVVLALGVGILIVGGSTDRLPWAVAGLVLLVVAYLVARPTAGDEDARRFTVFTVVATVAMAAMSFADASLSTMQVIVYPLVWIFAPLRRDGVTGSIAIGAGLFVGYAGGYAFVPEVVAQGAAVAVLSVAFSIAMGWWISAIAAYGTERARLLDELSRAQQQVAALSRDKGAADEREHLAREIHDTLAQTLAGIVMLAEQAGRRSHAGDTDGAAAAVQRLEVAARDALGEARAIVARTAAVPADPVLAAAVERLAERFRADTGLEISVVDTASGVDRETQVVALRCLQEALANVRKHAGAARVTVSLSREDDGALRLAVEDDGRGFDVASPRTGYGLDGMSDRVALAGGTVEVAAAAGAGTTLTVRLPASQGTPVAGASLAVPA
ncbi:sensor histidine kinase [Microbacterium sp. 2P01SA-2]|uniref:sensor histidine kinase n=1 Tax=unclassified Microbacterium TaxID=2609290 RepID=UPI0039A1D93D